MRQNKRNTTNIRLPVKGGAPQTAELGCGGLMTYPEWKKVVLQNQKKKKK